ncbi:MAG: TMAO reductase system periplasmic protein TorT, partial [Aestuariibacter sp.]|nr:TMAO reductase system periplasmic protein TorT [Aestuariibacter sp.]
MIFIRFRGTRSLQSPLFFAVLLAVTIAQAEPWRLETWSTAFDYTSASRIIDYQPTAPASRAWHLCIAYPHLKDAYWLNVNYGMVQEAKRLGVAFTLVEAGGYPNLERQRQQVEQCAGGETDALIVGTVSFRGLNDSITRIAKTMPVLATVNDIDDNGISAKSGVS